jgi:hypothetical protein
LYTLLVYKRNLDGLGMFGNYILIN